MERNIISIARMLYDPKKRYMYMSVWLSKFTLMGRSSCQQIIYTSLLSVSLYIKQTFKIPTTLCEISHFFAALVKCLAECQDQIIGNRQGVFGLMQLNGVNMHHFCTIFLNHSYSVVNMWNMNVLSSKQLQIWQGKKIAVGFFQRSKCFSHQKEKIVFIADAVCRKLLFLTYFKSLWVYARGQDLVFPQVNPF